MNAGKWFLLFWLWLLPFSAASAQSLEMRDFMRQPVMQDGRIKPLGRMAQLTLQKITGQRQSIDHATHWLAALLFDPGNADTPAIFNVPQRSTRHLLDLPERQDHLYRFEELNAALIAHAELVLPLRDIDPAKRTPEQHDLFDLYIRVITYEQLKQSLTLVLPLKTEGDAPVRLIDLPLPIRQKPLYQNLLAQGKNNITFLVIPEKSSWVAPWMLYPNDDPLLKKWGDLADAYIQQNPDAWRYASADLYLTTMKRAQNPGLDFRLRVELAYLGWHPAMLSLGFYALGLLLLLKPRLSFAAMAAGLGFHVLGIVARILILQRPPVSDLYESLLFVGALVVGITLFYGWRRKETLSLLAGGVLGIALQGAGIALGFSMGGDYDTLKVLQAVLDTKFWLATHVLVITAGYALCLLTSAVAHGCLWRYPGTRKMRDRLYLLSLISLAFIVTGTLLGGVWADQSWGRFWGWDPKENGALLIALWLIWLLHGRISRHVSDLFFVMGLAALSLVVALSWIGINLLGVGLHSYGFLQGSASSLIALFAVEAGFFFYCWKKHAP